MENSGLDHVSGVTGSCAGALAIDGLLGRGSKGSTKTGTPIFLTKPKWLSFSKTMGVLF
jgi:hypothetical protein